MSFVIGIGGGSGSGKSTIADLLAAELKPLSVSVVHLDQFFRPPECMPSYYSSLHDGRRPNFNHPDSFDQTEMFARCGERVEQAEHEVVIMEGILALYFSPLRSLMDLACYVSIDIDEMLRRRTARNLAAGYGGTAEEIDWYNRECVRPEHLRFNAPSADHAELLIPNDVERGEERSRAIADICRLVRDRPHGRS